MCKSISFLCLFGKRQTPAGRHICKALSTSTALSECSTP